MLARNLAVVDAVHRVDASQIAPVKRGFHVSNRGQKTRCERRHEVDLVGSAHVTHRFSVGQRQLDGLLAQHMRPGLRGHLDQLPVVSVL